MRYRTFPNTNLTVSEVGFGVWTLTAGWWGDYTQDQAAGMLRKAFDLGVTLFDTADTYGVGRGEELLPKAFPTRRTDIVIATKFGYDIYNHPTTGGQQERPQVWTKEFIVHACNQSLKRLGTDYIDLYQLHNPKQDAFENDELFGALEELQTAGKIRYYAAALGPAIGWRNEGLYALEHRTLHGLQIIHNLLEQEPGSDFIEAARKKGVGIFARVPHSSGMLEGKYTLETTFPPEDHRSHRPRQWLVDGLKKIEQLKFLYEGRNQTLGQAALKWLLAEPLMISTLPNIYDEDQLVEFATASDKPDLTRDDMAKIAELYAHKFYLGVLSEEEREAVEVKK